jgi:hypothetical protein
VKKVTFNHKNLLKPTPKIILRVVNAVQSCCAMTLGMAIYSDNKTILYIASTISILCHFINTYAGVNDKNN